uniref:NACHT domain-containing protein n=1 Tax=uncultured Thiodictyon sp. TaxID=1846217 RepID=UPI0025D17069
RNAVRAGAPAHAVASVTSAPTAPSAQVVRAPAGGGVTGGGRNDDQGPQFYEVCSRALLEEWDQTQSRDRANQFDRPHKEILLAALAYAHITGEDPARDIDEDWALALLAAEMERALGLERAGNHKLLEELVQNAGLLVRLPPNGLRFPHQTFLEFFAAAHLLAAADLDGMLALYGKDPGRWREVLLLYSGLCTQPTAVSRILATLLDRGELGLALTALTEARVVDPATAGLVLDAAGRDLAAEPEPQVIASLGYLAANPLTTYGTRAGGLLHDLLRERGADLPAPLLQELLLAALRRPSPELTGFLIDNLERLDLGRILPAMAEDALLVSTAVLRQTETPLAKRCEWIDGLRRAQAVGVLFDLEGRPWLEPELEQAVAVALARCSTLDEFWSLVDRTGETPDRGADARPEDTAVLARWGWPYQPPATERGRFLCCRLARHLSRELSEEGLAGVHPRIEVLACALAVADGGGSGWYWEPAKVIANGTAGALRAIWRRAAGARWARWVETDEDISLKISLKDFHGQGWQAPLPWPLAATGWRERGSSGSHAPALAPGLSRSPASG